VKEGEGHQEQGERKGEHVGHRANIDKLKQ